MFQAYACSGTTGVVIDRVDVSSFSWERLLSARGSGEIKIPLDGTYTKAQLRALSQPWSILYALEYNGRLLYNGYVTKTSYTAGRSALTLHLSDLWAILARRGSWDHSAPNVEKWKVTHNVSLAQHALLAVLRGRTGPALPVMDLPVTLPGFGGTAVSRTWFGYHVQMVDDVLQDLMGEGLDIFFEPRWGADGDADWLMQAGPTWTSARTPLEFYVGAPMSAVSEFSAVSDGARITNNARRVGEGSEQDMLVRSSRNRDSPYPLLDRTTAVKQVKDVNVLARQALADLKIYGGPTDQWDFKVHIDQAPQVGDRVRLHFDRDPMIDDGWHERRVVKVTGSMSEFVQVSLQPTGGA